MSNLGQGVAAVAGAVIGFYVGGPTGAAYGFELGLMAGTALFPTQLAGVNGPRLEDAETVAATPGAPVAIIYGTYAIAGFRMWLGAVTEHSSTTTEGGKGAPEQSSTTYTYTQPLAIGLCEGPITGVLRIWENGELVYDIRPQLEDESDDAFAARSNTSAAYAAGITVYPGDEDQLPDPSIEMDKGAGNVPAFRGLAYIVYHDRLLRDDQARRHPQFKIEVAAGSLVCVDSVQYSNEVLFPWGPDGEPDPHNVNIFKVYATGKYADDPPGADTTEYISEGAATAAGAAATGFWGDFIGISEYESLRGVGHVEVLGSWPIFPIQTRSILYRHYNPIPPQNFRLNDFDLTGEQNLTDAGIFGPGNPTVLMDNYFNFPASYGAASCSVWKAAPYGELDYPFQNAVPTGVAYTWVVQCLNRVIQVIRKPGPPADPCEGLGPSPLFPGFCIDEAGRYVKGGGWTKDTGNSYAVLAIWSQNGEGAVQQPLNPCRPVGHPDNTEPFWTAAYVAARDAGLMPAGLTYSAPVGSDPGGSHYPRIQDFGYLRDATICTLNAGQVGLGSIVADLCLRAGLNADQVDVSELDAVLINGFLIGTVMPARSAIDPLRSVGWFDVVEDAPVLRFPRRGRAVGRTFEAEDLGATDAENGESDAPAITTRKLQDVELPRSTRVHYVAPSRDYDAGEQISPSRLTTDATNDVDVMLPVAIDDDFAAQIAEVLWADAWRSRWVHAVSLDSSSLELLPADVVEVPVDGRLQRMRITAIDDAEGLVRKLDLCRDDDGSYVSHAVAAAPDRPLSQVNVRRDSELLLLDLPALRDQDNDAGIYLTAVPTGVGTTWRGAVISKSIDGGATWTEAASVVSKPTAGRVVTQAGPGITTTWDTLNSLLVDLDSGAFESRSEEAVLNGANAVAVGVDGRWEIIQFLDAEEVSPDRWRLTGLLRGRRGTERFVGTGFAGDHAVLVSGAGIVRLVLQAAEIGADRLYRAVTIGAAFTSGTDVTFAGHGMALLPFSVIDLAVEASGVDYLITWRRRDRLSQELRDGADIPMSEATESYAVRIYAADGTTLLRTLTASTNSATYTGAMQDADLPYGSTGFVVAVAQLSAVVGGGPEVREPVALAPPPAVEHTLTFAFSGTFDTAQVFDALATYTPSSGSAVTSSHRINGTGKAAVSDYVTALAALFDADLPGAVVVSIVGDSVVLTTSSGLLTGSVQTHAEYGGTYMRQEPLPAQSGRSQILVVDLWADVAHALRAPDTSSAYATGGVGTISWNVRGLTYDIDESIGYGKSQATGWSVSPTAGNRLAALAGLADKIGYGSQGTGNVPQANLKDYIAGCLLGLFSGTTQARSAVAITLKPGYFIEYSYPSAAGGHPSGYALVTEEVQSAIADFPSGAKQETTIFFSPLFDSSGFVAGLFDGQVLFIDIDAHHYEHTVTSGEASDPATQYNAGTIYEDFKTQIEADGECTVIIRDALTPGGVSYHLNLSVERNVANTPFTYAAGSDFGLAIAISNT